MKIRKLHIENFQSIKDIEFNYESSGVNYYQGDNNIGKSSIIKAINTLFFNASNQVYRSFIRDDEDSFYISMTDFDNNVVELSRGKVDFYRWNINGVEGEFNRTSGKVPDELKEYFGLYFDEKSKECVNIRLPRAVLLGVDTSFSDNNYLLQKALKSEVYTLAYKKADSLRKSNKKEVDLLHKYYDSTKESIDKIELEEDKNKLDEIERFQRTIQAEYEKYEIYNHLDLLITETMDTKLKLRELTTTLEIADSIEDEFEYFKQISRVEKLGSNTERLTESIEVISEEILGAEEYLTDIETNIGYVSLLNTTMTQLDEYGKSKKELKKINDVIELESSIEGKIDYYSSIKAHLGLQESLDDFSNKLENTEKELEDLQIQLTKLEEDMGVCPLCGSEFTGEHTHV